MVAGAFAYEQISKQRYEVARREKNWNIVQIHKRPYIERQTHGTRTF